jgi:hypothetical protein
MEPQEYETVPHRIKVLAWPESSEEDLENLLGGEHVRTQGSGVQVRNGDGAWVTLADGWHATVTDGGVRIVMSPASFAELFRPAT